MRRARIEDVQDGELNADAAWFYADPKSEAEISKDRFAPWKGVKVET